MQNNNRLLSYRLILCSILVVSLCVTARPKSNARFGLEFLRDEYPRRSLQGSHHRIAGGYIVKDGEIPSFISLLGYAPPKVAFCSGVAITEQLILTAAHCFGNTVTKILAAPGTVSQIKWISEEVKTYEVVKSCPSRHYDRETSLPTHDYQILRLKYPIEGIKPAILPTKQVPIGYQALAAGTGIIDNTRYPYTFSDSLRALPVKRVKCNRRFSHPTQICFQSYEPQYIGDTCLGDSGGPIYGKSKDGRDVVIALTSFGSPECLRGMNGISVNANTYAGLDEIKELVESCLSDE